MVDRFEPVVFYDDDVAVTAMQQDKNGRYVRYEEAARLAEMEGERDEARRTVRMAHEEGTKFALRVVEANELISMIEADCKAGLFDCSVLTSNPPQNSVAYHILNRLIRPYLERAADSATACSVTANNMPHESLSEPCPKCHRPLGAHRAAPSAPECLHQIHDGKECSICGAAVTVAGGEHE